MNRSLTFVLVLLCPLILSACAGNQGGHHASSQQKVANTLEEMQLEPRGKVDRISRFQIDNWRYIDDHHIIIEAGHDDHYLVEFNQPCFGISSAFRIGFTDSVGGLTQFDRILVENRGIRGTEQCHIREIVQLVERK